MHLSAPIIAILSLTTCAAAGPLSFLWPKSKSPTAQLAPRASVFDTGLHARNMMAVWLQNIKRQTSPNITIPVPLYTDLVGAYIGVQDWVRTIEGVTGFTQIWAPFNESMTAVEEYVNKTG